MINAKNRKLLELNRKLVEELKENNSIEINNINLMDIVDTDLISFVLMNRYAYNKNKTYNYIFSFLKESVNIFIKNIKYFASNERISSRKLIGIFIPNKKQEDIYKALKESIQRNKIEIELIPIIWQKGNKYSYDRKVDFNKSYTFFGFIKYYIMMRNKISRFKFKISDELLIEYSELLDVDVVNFNIEIKNLIRDYIKVAVVYIAKFSSNVQKLQKTYGFDAFLFTNERELIAKSTILGLSYFQKVKTYGLQRGVILDHPEVGEVMVDKMFVDGKWYKNNIISRGGNSNKIEVVGSPRLDILLNEYKVNKNLYLKKYKIPEDKNIFLVITEVRALGVSEKDESDYLKKVLEILKKYKNHYIIVKAHPNQNDISMEEKVIKEVLDNKNVLLMKDEDVFELLSMSNFVITEFSTVGTEAIAIEKPILIPKFNKNEDPLNLRESGIAYEFSDYETLKEAISKNHINIQPSFIFDYYYKLDGCSSKRVLECINNEINFKEQEIR